VSCATLFQLGLFWVGRCCELRSVAVRRQVDGFICCTNSPRLGRISGAAKTEGNEPLGRSVTRVCQKAGLVHRVREGRDAAHMRSGTATFPLPWGQSSWTRTQQKEIRQTQSPSPSNKSGRKDISHHPLPLRSTY
jgi:hypothetical protein